MPKYHLLICGFALAACSSEPTVAPDAGGANDSSVADGSQMQDGSVAESNRLMLGMTVHLENNTFDDAYFAELNATAAIFAAHGAYLTFEPRDEVVQAVQMRTDDVFANLEDAGHAFGSHLTFSASSQSMFLLLAQMRRNNLLMAVDHVEHGSGACPADLDWVAGLSEAGFTVSTGTTVNCLLSIPSEMRPAEYTDLVCHGATDATCHRSYPNDIETAMHPWRAGSAATWLTPDPEGSLVIITGRGTLDCLHEEEQPGGAMGGNCTLEQNDLDLALPDLDNAIAHIDPARTNTFYWIWSYGRALDHAALEVFLDAVDERVAAGTVQWNTISEMHAAFESRGQ